MKKIKIIQETIKVLMQNPNFRYGFNIINIFLEFKKYNKDFISNNFI